MVLSDVAVSNASSLAPIAWTVAMVAFIAGTWAWIIRQGRANTGTDAPTWQWHKSARAGNLARVDVSEGRDLTSVERDVLAALLTADFQGPHGFVPTRQR
jgi:hypothetical protein